MRCSRCNLRRHHQLPLGSNISCLHAHVRNTVAHQGPGCRRVASGALSCQHQPLRQPSCCCLHCQTCPHHWCWAFAEQPVLAAGRLGRCCQEQTCCAQSPQLLCLGAAVALLHCHGQGLFSCRAAVHNDSWISAAERCWHMMFRAVHIIQSTCCQNGWTKLYTHATAARQSPLKSCKSVAYDEQKRPVSCSQQRHSQAPPPGVGLSSITDLCCWMVVICSPTNGTQQDVRPPCTCVRILLQDFAIGY